MGEIKSSDRSNTKNTFSEERSEVSYLKGLFWGLWLTILVTRVWILTLFSFKVADSDQSIMWYAAKEFAQGRFHEPRFYGQSYNTMIEALLSVPLIELGVPVYYALPIITLLLSLVPVFILSFIAFRNMPALAVMVLAVFMTLPIEYSLITSMPRGFVTGIAFSSLAIPLLYKNASKISFFLTGLIPVIAFSINPNAVILSIPIILIYGFQNQRKKELFGYAFLGLIAGIVIHASIQFYYVLNPMVSIHKSTISFFPEGFLDGVKNMSAYFGDVTPVFWGSGWAIFVLITVIGALLWRKNRIESAVAFLTIPMILSTLFVSKIHEGNDSIFFSYSRMYLAVPLLLLFLLSRCSLKINKTPLYVFSFLAGLVSIYNVAIAQEIRGQHLAKYGVVNTLKLHNTKNQCADLDVFSRFNNVELIIIANHWGKNALTYACPAIEGSFPEILNPSYDRRHWKLVGLENKVFENVLVLETQRRLDIEYPEFEISTLNPHYYLLKANQLSTRDLIAKYKIPVRKY